ACGFVVCDPVGDEQDLSVEDMNVTDRDYYASLLVLFLGFDLHRAFAAIRLAPGGHVRLALVAAFRPTMDHRFGRPQRPPHVARGFPRPLRRAGAAFDFPFDGCQLLRPRRDTDHTQYEGWQEG